MPNVMAFCVTSHSSGQTRTRLSGGDPLLNGTSLDNMRPPQSASNERHPVPCGAHAFFFDLLLFLGELPVNLTTKNKSVFSPMATGRLGDAPNRYNVLPIYLIVKM